MSRNPNFIHKTEKVDPFKDSFQAASIIPLVQTIDGVKTLAESPIVVINNKDLKEIRVSYDGLAADYSYDELDRIGGGEPMSAVQRVVGAFSIYGGVEAGQVKPHHPTMVDSTAEVIPYPEQLPASSEV